LTSVWVYNGDTDPCVSYEGTRTAIERVGFPEVDGGSYRPWFYNHTATTLRVLEEKSAMFGPDLLVQPTGAQFGGEVVNYENGLAFLTVHGSGHMVPQFRPQAALHMIQKLTSYEELSPLFPTNQTLLKMSDVEFVKEMNDWTEKAKASPYVDNVGWV
jgi:cathepsin A (carboxypeptidase C)